MRATVITDASFCPSSRAGGWAAWVAFDGGHRQRQAGKFNARPSDSNEAELWACCNGLWIALAYGARDVLLQSDSITALKLLPSYGTLDGLRTQFGEFDLRTKHVKGHGAGEDARGWVNNWCDREAKKHMREMRAKRPKRRR